MNAVAVGKRLMSRVEFSRDGCWLSGHSRTPWGYAQISRGGGRDSETAHRVSYELFKGPIPQGYQVDHLCRVRHCVNPEHLEVVTKRENILRGRSCVAHNATKTHCPHGHAYDAENTLVSGGKRFCRTCGRAKCRAQRRAA